MPSIRALCLCWNSVIPKNILHLFLLNISFSGLVSPLISEWKSVKNFQMLLLL